jgi:hypothetical protein
MHGFAEFFKTFISEYILICMIYMTIDAMIHRITYDNMTGL